MTTGPPIGGTWGLTAVMVVIVSWVLYRYLAPASWKEWSRAGMPPTPDPYPTPCGRPAPQETRS